MNKLKDLIIKKHSAMIQTNAKELTLVERKIINALVYIAQKTGEAKEYTMRIPDLKNFCGIKTVGNDELKKHLYRLADIKIEFNYLNKDKNEVWELMVLLAGAKLEKNTGIITFSFTPLLQEKILNPKMYAPLKILMIASLKNRYSIVLYELLRDYKDAPKGMPKITIEEFRNLMGVSDGKYLKFYDLKRYVLKVATKEINKKTDIKCTYKLSKSGNRYTHIKFYVESVQKPEDKKLLMHRKKENENQLELNLAENSLNISKEFSIPKKVVAEWSENIGSEKLDEVYEYTKAKKPKNPAGYMRTIIESGSDLSGISQISKEEKINKMKAAAQGCMMKHVTDQKHCGKTYEDALDPETNCFYCYFKENGTLKRTQKTEKELLQEQEEKQIKECISMLKENNLIENYTERVRQDPSKASALNFFAKSPNTYLNMLNSYIYDEWKKEQQIN